MENLHLNIQQHPSFETTSEATRIGLWDWEVNTDAVVYSSEWKRQLGYAEEEIGMHIDEWANRVHPEDLPMARERLADYLAQRLPKYEAEFRMRHKDGSWLWILSKAGIIRYEDGRAVQMLGCHIDITRHKQAASQLEQLNKALRESQQKLEEAQRIAHLGHWERNLEDDSITWSEEVYRIFGIPLKTGGLHFEDLYNMVLEEDRAKWTLAYDNAILGLGQYDVEYRVHRPDGEVRYVHSRGEAVRDASGSALRMFGIAQDITERKRAEEAQRESENRFRQVAENIDEVFWLTDMSKKEMIYISPAYEKIWGRSCKDLYRRPLAWSEAIHPEDLERVLHAARTLQASGGYDVTYRIERPDGEIRWIHDRCYPIKDEEGKVYRLVGVANDITVYRELEEKLRQSQKMEAVGLLAGGIAHDFNNLLAVIQMRTSMLLAAQESTPKQEDGMLEIMDASERAANLTRQLLAFSRREIKQAKDLNLADVVDSTIKLLRRILGEHITLETLFAPSLPAINADPGMMEQVIMNLAINARDAMPDGGRLSVMLQPVNLDEARAAMHPGTTAGPFVCLSVADTGGGISQENLERIFEPFFTTKDPGRGTGLGLATVFGIVKQHGGCLEVDSVLMQGTTFRVYLPALPASIALSAGVCSTPAVCGGHEIILLVEDDPALLSALQAALEHCGYRVFPAATAAAALTLWKQEQGAVDLLLTDVVMPGGMSGRELADHLLKEKPDLKVIHTSGYCEDIVPLQLREDAGGRFLQKPYAMQGLVQAVRSRLDER